MLTPARRRGVEILDDPTVDPGVRRRATGDIAVSNRLLGGLRAPLSELRTILAEIGPVATLLDVGTGFADIPHGATALARDCGVTLTTIGVDSAAPLLSAHRARLTHAVCGDALSLPFADSSIDVVLCSQLLHHFERADAERVVGEMNRVARRAVIVSDLRRSWFAAAGFWLVAVPLGFHRVTRHDGVLSVLRGFTTAELGAIIQSSTGTAAHVRRRVGYRITASWQPPSMASR